MSRGVSPPRKAMVLAAGYGERMRPLTLERPKPLLPLWNRSLLERMLRMLRAWGVRDVLLNAHHLPGAILNEVRRGPVEGLRVAIVFEPVILGTGGALRNAAWFFDEQPFWLVNGDIAADLDPEPLLRGATDPKTLASVWLDDTRGPRTVEVRDGRVLSFRGGAGGHTLCGVHGLKPDILRYVPEGPSSLIEAYEKAIQAGRSIRARVQSGAFWADLGTPEQYLDAHAETREAHRLGRRGGGLYDPCAEPRALRAEARDFASVEEGARIAPGARLTRTVVWAGAVVGPRTVASDAVIGRGAYVNGPVKGRVVRLEALRDPVAEELVLSLGWKVARTVAMPLDARGSDRWFVRLQSGLKRAMLVRWTEARPENDRYAGHARFLSRMGISVPHVSAGSKGRRALLMEDVGDRSLQSARPGFDRRSARRWYERALDLVLVLHIGGAAAARRARLSLMPPFDETLYRWEHEYFIERFLRARMTLTTSLERALRDDLRRNAQRLLRAPPVLIHRDFQSSNLHVHRGRLWLLDFQGMRLGAAAYDLASLLCDPYVAWEEGFREAMLGYYMRRCPWPGDVEAGFWPAAVQRLCQALGAYGNLSSRRSTAGFARYIAPALDILEQALDCVDDLPALRTIVARMKDRR